MIISHKQIQSVLQAYAREVSRLRGKDPAERPPRPDSLGGPDKVSLSAKAQEAQKVREAVKRAPDVRAEKVSKVKAALDEGKYEPSAEQIAEKMLGRMVVDRLLQDRR